MTAPDDDRSAREPVSVVLRYALLLLAGFCVGLGVVGVFVPGLPTTVFILIAGWAAARSSPRFSAWLESHRVFGTMLRNWRETGSVSRRSKWTATAMMALCAVILFLTTTRPWLAEGVTALMALALVWLWNRPLPPAERAVETNRH
jgi:uncharacterized membrane protein YbaN (DUF454 family)